MKLLPGFAYLAAVFAGLGLPMESGAQTLPGSLSFSVDGSFVNGTAQSQNSILLTDNDLTNGYDPAFDLTDAPANLDPKGPAGSAAFQWGEISSSSGYPHTSSLWFSPINVGVIAPEQSFEIANLFYRNGTIKTTTGATAVDIAMTVSYSQPLGLDPINVVFGTDLINTVNNNNDPVGSADIVGLRNRVAALDFSDNYGNRYYMELTFQVDQNTIDGTLSSADQFRVFEGGQGSATLLGRFTTTPVGFTGTLVPEPSSAIIGALGMLFLLRRRR